MQPKSYFHELPEKEKRDFYSQEIFVNFNVIRNRLLLIVTAMIVIDTILTSVIAPIFDPTYPRATSTLRLLLLIFAGLTYSIPYINRFQLILAKYNKLKIFFHCLAAILYSSYLFLVNSDYLNSALQTNRQEDWGHAYVALSLSIHITFLISLISPAWYLKILISGSYYLAITVVYFRNNIDSKEWIVIRNFFSFTYVLALVILTSDFRWRIFLKSSESKAWNRVYNDILNAIPNAIFVLDHQGRTVYQNSEFHKLTGGNEKELFQNISKVKIRDNSSFSKNCEQNSALQIFSDDSKGSFHKEDHLLSNGLFSPTQKISSTLQFSNFNDMLDFYKHKLTNNTLDPEQVTYDAKLTKPQSENQTLSYEIVINPLIEHQKIIIILNNTTQRDLIASLEDNNHFKDKLLASVSHELRTPLNGNLGFLQTALHEEDVPQLVKERLLLPALRSGKLLFHIINDILDFSKMERNKISLHFGLRPLRESLEYCYNMYEFAFKAKKIEFSLEIDPNMSLMIKTDHERLIQVILNLLSNALKFTMKGKVTISAKVHIEGTHLIEIKVADTGIGIPKENALKLFEEFQVYNIEPLSPTINAKSAGLGLKIANRLSKMLGPKEGAGIQLKSNVGKGSEFYFILMDQRDMLVSHQCTLVSKSKMSSINLEEENQKHSMESDITALSAPEEFKKDERRPSNALEIALQRKLSIPKTKTSFPCKEGTSYLLSSFNDIHQHIKKVLIVDDDLFNILALESLLKQLNVQVESANNGKQALEKVNRDPSAWGLIFMDCQMPVMDGYEASKKLTDKMDKGELPFIPIVGYTAFSAKDKLQECIKSGMREVINKPAMRDHVKEVLEKYFK